MKSPFLPFCLILLAAALALPVSAPANDGHKDEAVSVAQCPEPVQKVIRQYTTQARLEGVAVDKKERFSGAYVYEAKFVTAAGKRMEIHISQQGTVLKTEERKPKR